MKEIIKVLDEKNPTYSYHFISGLLEMAQIPLSDKSGVVQAVLDELRD